MCFSNLPIEFDDEGNPYLAQEADEVDRSHEPECGCDADLEDIPLEDTDPESMYAVIVAGLPDSVRERLEDGPGAHGSGVDESGEDGLHDSAEGD